MVLRATKCHLLKGLSRLLVELELADLAAVNDLIDFAEIRIQVRKVFQDVAVHDVDVVNVLLVDRLVSVERNIEFIFIVNEDIDNICSLHYLH